MSIETIIFYLIAAFILVMAILSVTTRKIFRAAIWLLFSLVGIASLYFWMDVNFIAGVQIIVYVGGIVVLIIFSLFLTQQSDSSMDKPRQGRVIAAIAACGLGVVFSAIQFYRYGFAPVDHPFNAEVSRIGEAMLQTGNGGFALPFEVVSILLLAAMVGCIVIAMRDSDQVPPSRARAKLEDSRRKLMDENKLVTPKSPVA